MQSGAESRLQFWKAHPMSSVLARRRESRARDDERTLSLVDGSNRIERRLRAHVPKQAVHVKFCHSVGMGGIR